MDLFTLFGTIGIDDGGAVNTINDVDSAGTKASNGGLAKVGKAAVVAGAAIATAGVAVGKWSYELGSNFQDKMAKASTLFGDVQVDTDNLQAKILELSGNTGVAADEIGESLYNALSAGVPATEDMSEAMDFLTKSTELSKAGFTDVDTAMSATVKVMNAYGQGMEDTDAIQKVLMQTQNQGIVTVDELGAVLSNVTPMAAAMGVSFDQVGASIATMTAAGIPAAQATTGLNGLLAELGKTGTTASGNLAAAAEGTEYAGMSFTDMMDAGVPLNEVLDMMSVYADDSGASMVDMFSSIEAGKAALSLSGENSDKFTESLAAMGTESDVVGDAFDKVSGTSSEKWSRAMAKMQGIGIKLFEKLEPVISKVMDIVIDNMPLIESLVDQFAPVITGLLENLLPILTTLVETVLPPMLDLFNKIFPVIMQVIEMVLPVFIELFDLIMPIIMDLVDAFLPVIIELVEMLLPPIMQIIEAVLPIIVELLNILLPLLGPIMEFLGPLIDVLMLILEPLIELIDLILPPLIDLIVGFYEKYLKSMGDALSSVADVLGGAFSDAFDAISGVIEDVQGVFNDIGDFLENTFSKNWSDIWDDISEVFSDIWDGFIDIAKSPINAIIGLINGMITQINKFKIDVPSWLTDLSGIKDFSFNISQLSYLKTGLDYVPYDNYPAMLHQGEKVLTKEEAKRNGSGASITININGNSAQSGRELLEQIETAVKQQTFAGGVLNGI
jgi:TP901 family phage tail tape measure protein